jgi:pimeloyl-ACP methyl ester carboxylesterase
MDYSKLDEGYAQTSLGKLHYRQHEGGGQKILFLHGYGATIKAWSRLVAQLPDGLSVYLLDLLGHGDSDAPHIKYTLDVQLQTVGEFIEKKGLEDGYLFGNSYGGWIAAAIAQGNFKGRGIILEDAGGLLEYFEDANEKEGADAYAKRMTKEAVMLNAHEHVAKSIMHSRDVNEMLTRESLSSIVKPTLVIWGEDDKVVDVKYGRLFSEYIKGSALEVIKGAGHVPHFTHAGRVSELLLEFVGYQQ